MKLTRKQLRKLILETYGGGTFPAAKDDPHQPQEKRGPGLVLHINYMGNYNLAGFTISDPAGIVQTQPAYIPSDWVDAYGPLVNSRGALNPDNIVLLAEFNACDRIHDDFLGYTLPLGSWREEFRDRTGI